MLTTPRRANWRLGTAALILFTALFPGGAVAADEAGEGGEPPTSTFTWEFSERIRLVTWDNAVTLGAAPGDTTFSRTLTALGGTWRPGGEFDLSFELANEFRYYWKPDRSFTLHEVFIRRLFARWSRPGGSPYTVTLGRQNLMLGEGFLIMDGNPLDGSRSVYFNAARVDLHLGPEGKDTLTGFAAFQPETDPLPTLNNKDSPLVEQPQRGFGLYYVRPRAGARLEGYVVHKREQPGDRYEVRSQITAAGSRAVVPLAERVTGMAEGALQWGRREEASVRAWGGHARVTWAPETRLPLPARLVIGGVYLSGDDPATDRWEGWNPLFSRWPKWSESYLYTLIPEQDGRPAYWTNWTSLNGALGFDLARDVELELVYHRLGAAHPHSAASPLPGGRGTRRGNLMQSILTWRVRPHWSGHVRVEHFRPGNFYRTDAEAYTWARVELMYRL